MKSGERFAALVDKLPGFLRLNVVPVYAVPQVQDTIIMSGRDEME